MQNLRICKITLKTKDEDMKEIVFNISQWTLILRNI